MMAMCDGGECFEVAHIAGGIADGLAKYRASIVIDQGFQIRSPVGPCQTGRTMYTLWRTRSAWPSTG